MTYFSCVFSYKIFSNLIILIFALYFCKQLVPRKYEAPVYRNIKLVKLPIKLTPADPLRLLMPETLSYVVTLPRIDLDLQHS